jgi:hypothetical protein
MSIRLSFVGLALFAVAGCGNNNALLNCPTMLYACTNACVDLASDSNNCGECSHSCVGGTVCVNGQCTGLCASQLTMCGVACVDTRFDHAHCGDCNTTCKVDEVCNAGKCAVSCSEGLTGCSGDCVDVGSDSDNCGTCGHACPHGHACAGGVCQVTCAPPTTACGDECVDTRYDPNHCASCDNSCPGGNNVVRFCISGSCGTMGCEMGFYDCDGQVGNGCETDGRSDVKNCGGCYNFCPQQGQNAQMIGCVDAKCVATQCDMGFGDCNMDANDGCESQLDSDPDNCGKCGNECAPPHMIATCTNSKCQIQGCEDGWTDCDGNQKNGCEANLNHDKMNCGMCGMACPMDHPFCGMGMCKDMPTLIGQYNVEDGPGWFNDPPTYTCLEACAMVFGGNPGDYSCSIDMNMITNTAWESGYADGGHCGGDPKNAFPEDYKKNTHYNCGSQSCSFSAYVSDNCFGSTNYCWQ